MWAALTSFNKNTAAEGQPTIITSPNLALINVIKGKEDEVFAFEAKSDENLGTLALTSDRDTSIVTVKCYIVVTTQVDKNAR